MEIERSCGAVVFTVVDGEYRFVIIQSLEGTYGFPKGHMKKYETERQTAIREIKEETGLDVKILPGFRQITEYIIPGNGHLKKVVYFLARYDEQTPEGQPEEIKSISLMSYEEAMKVLYYRNSRDVLHRAYHVINKNHY